MLLFCARVCARAPPQVLLYVFWCPFFSYLSVIATEAGMVDLKDLKPHLLRLMVHQGEMAKLMAQRRALQVEVRRLVKRYGPDMGGAYFDRSVSWNHLAAANKERALSSDKDQSDAIPRKALLEEAQAATASA
jgi:hypothetical protein